MKLSEIQNVTVAGAGIMGQGIAFSFAKGGFETTIYDISQDALDIAMAHIKHHMQEAVDAELFSEMQMNQAYERLHPTLEIETAAKGCDFFMEAVPEILGLKQKIFKDVEALTPAHTIMATNASHLPPEKIFSQVTNTSRTLLVHWFNPPQLVPVVEVARLPQTDALVWDLTAKILTKAGKQPIKIKTPIQGLIVNRIFGALVREITYLMEQDIAEPVEIDNAIKGTLAFRSLCIGFIKSWDLGGLDDWYDMTKHLFPELNSSIDPPKSMRELIDAGHTGIRSGRGFYKYDVGFANKGEVDPSIKERNEMMMKLLKIYTY